MSPDRLDDLLDRALSTGTIPADTTAEERAELEPLLEQAGSLRLDSRRVHAEADERMPNARARFQRHLADARRPAAPVAAGGAPRQGWLSRFFGGGMMAYASSAAAIGVIAVLAILVLQPFGGAETAQALTIDDYVQVQGVVAASNDGTVTIQSADLGNLEVALSDLTAVSDESGVRDPSSLRPGDPVLVSGVVTARRAIAASNVAVSQNQGAPTPGGQPGVPLLKSFRQGLQGTIALLTLSPDGKRARVLLVTPAERLLVDVDPRSMDQFLAENPGAIGARVRVVEAADLPKGVFRLQPVSPPATSPTPDPQRSAGPEFQNVRGVIVGRAAATLMVQTDRGVVPVVIRPLTSIRFGDSGLTPDDVRDGETVIGYEVAISGNRETPDGRRVVASIIVVLGKAPERPAPR